MRSEVLTRVTGGVVGAALTIAGTLLLDGSSPGARAVAAPDALTSSASCAALRQWYVDRTVALVGPYGWNQTGFAERQVATDGVAAPTPASAASAGGTATGVANGPTGTNVQQAGVDEPDVAKTDGHVVVRLLGQRRVVLTDVTGSTPRELATWTLPRATYADGLLLVDHHVLVVAQSGLVAVPADGTVASGGIRGPRTVVDDLDVSDPSAPRLVSRTSWSGTSLSMRQYGGVVRLVTDTGLPGLPFVQPATRPYEGATAQRRDEAEATRRNRQVVEDSTLADWLPTVTRDGTTRPAVDCADVLHPRDPGSPTTVDAIPADTVADTVGVFTWSPGSGTAGTPVAITGSGTDAYSSADRLYVWSSGWVRHVRPYEPGVQAVRPAETASTTLHEFALDGASTRYVATGQVAGLVRDRWSLDEYAGHLRVALSYPSGLPGGPIAYGGGVVPGSTGDGVGIAVRRTDNGVAVLDTVGDRLVTVGQVRGLGRGEELQAVRWLGPLAVLVTFHQTDPVFTLDLTDPAHPHPTGQLRLPGFSAYLHPIGDQRLLGLGVAGASQDTTPEAKVSVLDVAARAVPRVVGGQVLGPDTWLAATGDPHAFTWIPGAAPGAGTALTTLLSGDRTVTSVLELRVAADGRVTSRRLPSPGGFTPRALPLPEGRVALVGTRIDLVSTSAG